MSASWKRMVSNNLAWGRIGARDETLNRWQQSAVAWSLVGTTASFAFMSGPMKVIADDDEAFTGIRPSPHRRHTLGGNASVASDSAHAPIVWRPVMPTGRRSTLVSSRSEDVEGVRATIDGSMRTKRSISDTTSQSRRSGDKSNFALHDVDAFSVERAKVIRRISEERYARFLDFFKSNEPEMAREIQARSAFSREQLDAWVNYIVSPKVLRCIIRSRDSQQELLGLLMVSAAISKYGESELMAKDRRGDLSAPQNIKLLTYDEYSSSHQEPVQADSKGAVAMGFVIRVNARLPEDRRVGDVVLREILAYASSMQISNETNSQADDERLDKEDERTRQIVMRVQSDWFQGAMIKANGRYLYDAIRQILCNVDEALWDASKDKLELQRVQKSDRVGAEVLQIERKSASEVQIRPRTPPPPPPGGLRPRMPPPPRPDEPTRDVSMMKGIPPVSTLINTLNRSSSMPAQEIQEHESFGKVKTRRKLQPLGSAPRPRILPPKRPRGKTHDAIAHTPSAFIIKAQELE